MASRETVVKPRLDPSCQLCPRGTRATGAQNPDYDATFVFDNDFSAVLPQITGDLPAFGDGNSLLLFYIRVVLIE